jgi:hypothetical protein
MCVGKFRCDEKIRSLKNYFGTKHNVSWYKNLHDMTSKHIGETSVAVQISRKVISPDPVYRRFIWRIIEYTENR